MALRFFNKILGNSNGSTNSSAEPNNINNNNNGYSFGGDKKVIERRLRVGAEALEIICDIMEKIELTDWERCFISRVYGLRGGYEKPNQEEFKRYLMGALYALDSTRALEVISKYNLEDEEPEIITGRDSGMISSEQEKFSTNIKRGRAASFNEYFVSLHSWHRFNCLTHHEEIEKSRDGTIRGGLYFDMVGLYWGSKYYDMMRRYGSRKMGKRRQELMGQFIFTKQMRCLNFDNHVTTYGWVLDQDNNNNNNNTKEKGEDEDGNKDQDENEDDTNKCNNNNKDKNNNKNNEEEKEEWNKLKKKKEREKEKEKKEKDNNNNNKGETYKKKVYYNNYDDDDDENNNNSYNDNDNNDNNNVTIICTILKDDIGKEDFSENETEGRVKVGSQWRNVNELWKYVDFRVDENDDEDEEGINEVNNNNKEGSNDSSINSSNSNSNINNNNNRNNHESGSGEYDYNHQQQQQQKEQQKDQKEQQQQQKQRDQRNKRSSSILGVQKISRIPIPGVGNLGGIIQ